MQSEAQQVLPGATALTAMRHLESSGEAIEGVEQIRLWLQQIMDEAIASLDGTHFDLADPLKTVQARIAKLAVGQSKTVTLTVTVRATPHGLSYFGPGTYNIGPSINLRSPTTVHIRGAGSNVSKANITLT